MGSKLMNYIKTTWKSRSETYDDLRTSRSDKVANFIKTNHSYEHNMKREKLKV